MFDIRDAESILANIFGHQQFRGRQAEVIQHLATSNHALVVMPTGMGKSICYQIPALAIKKTNASKKGLSLVLSPLVALMKDQVDALKFKNVNAEFINSSLTGSERANRYRALADDDFDLIYVTPERFRKSEFLESIADRTIDLLAVDEAHCISEWGHDFRPDYTRVGEIRQQLGSPLTIALTATATPDVQADIVRQLGLKASEMKLFHQGINRPNLSLSVDMVWDDDAKLEVILEKRKTAAWQFRHLLYVDPQVDGIQRPSFQGRR